MATTARKTSTWLPDAAMIQAVESLQKNQKFKRMLVFALKNIADLSNPPNRKFVHNAFYTVEKKVPSVLDNVVDAHLTNNEDHDISAHILKILLGISKALLDTPDEEMRQLVGDSVAATVLAKITGEGISVLPSDDKTSALNGVQCVLNFKTLGFMLQNEKILGGILSYLDIPKMSVMDYLSIMSAIRDLSKTAEGCQILLNTQTLNKLLTIVSGVRLSEKDACNAAGVVFDIINQCGVMAPPINDPTILPLVSSLIDKVQGRRAVQDKGSQALSVLITPDQLKSLLQSMAKTATPEETLQSLSLLSAMSHMANFNKQLIAANALEPLCKALTSAAESFDPSDGVQRKGLNDGCRILISVASMPDQANDLVKRGVLETLSILGCKLGPSTIELGIGIVKIITELALADSKIAGKVADNTAMMKNILELVEKTCETKDDVEANHILALEVSRLLCVLGAADSGKLVKKLLGYNAENTAMMILKNESAEATVTNVLKFIASIYANGHSPAGPRRSPNLAYLIQTLNSAESEQTALLGVKLVEKFGQLAKAEKNNYVEELVNAGAAFGLLSVLARFGGSSPQISSSANSALSVVAGKNDVQEALGRLERATMSPSKDTVSEAFKAFLTVEGLSAVGHLKSQLIDQKAADVVLKCVTAVCAASPKFEQQAELACAGFNCFGKVCTAVGDSIVDANRLIDKSLALAQLPQMKQLAATQQEVQDDNVVVCLIRGTQALIKAAAGGSQIDNAIPLEGVSAVMRRYPESRLAQKACLETFTDLVKAGGADTSKKFFQIGTAKQVFAYLQKSYVHEDVQIAGVYLMTELIKQDETASIESLRMCGAVELLKATARAHASNAGLQRLLSVLLARLIPAEALQAEVEQYINLLKVAAQNRDHMTGNEALANLLQLSGNIEAAKHASKLGVIDALDQFNKSINSDPPIPDLSKRKAHENGSLLIRNVASAGRPYTTQMIRANAMELLQDIIMSNTKVKDDPKHKQVYLDCLGGCQRLLQGERNTLQFSGVCKMKEFLLKEAERDDLGGSISAQILSCLALMNDPEIYDAPITAKLLANAIACMSDPNTSVIDNKMCVSAIISVIGATKLVSDNDAFSKSLLANALADTKLKDALISVLDTTNAQTVKDPDFVNSIQKCLAEVTALNQGLPQKSVKGLNDGQASGNATYACKAFGRNLGMCMADANAAAINIRLVAGASTRNDKKSIEGSGFLDDLQELIGVHADSVPVRAAVGELLGKLGMEDVLDSLWARMIELCDEKPEGYRTSLLDLFGKLDLFIAMDSRDTDLAFGKAPRAIESLSRLLDQSEGDIELHQGAALVGRRLAERFHSDLMSPYGASCLRTTLMPKFIQIIRSPDTHPLKFDNLFLRDAYHMLAEVFPNDQCQQDILDVLDCDSNSLLANSYYLLKMKKNEPEVASAILKFLAMIAKSENGVQILENPKNRDKIEPRFLGENLDGTIIDMISKNKKRSIVVDAGAEFLVNHIKNPKKGTLSIYNEAKTAERMLAIGQDSPAGACAFMNVAAALTAADPSCVCVEGCLAKAAKIWHNLEADDKIAKEDKARCAESLADLIGACAVAHLNSEINSVDCPGLLRECLERHAGQLEVVRAVAKGAKKLAEEIPEMRMKLVSQVCPVLLSLASPAIQNDVESAMASLELLKLLLVNEKNAGMYLREMNGLMETLGGVESLGLDLAETEHECSEMLLNLVKDVRKLLSESESDVMSLESIYTRWLLRVEQGNPVDCTSEELPIDEINFVFQYTEEYSSQQHTDINSEVARELFFGFACFQLLCETPQNIPYCIERDCQVFMMNTIRNQQNQEVCQWAVQAAVLAVCGSLEAAKKFSAHPQGPQIITQSIAKALALEKERDTYLCLRLKLAAGLALDRNYYNGTPCMEKCIEIWDEYDDEKLTVETLKAAFKVMRKIVNDHWLSILIEREVPERLLEIVENRNSPHDLLVDTLFLIGATAVVPEIKTALGELKGIEIILDLCKRCEKEAKKQDTSKTEQNACLALANLNMGHGKNSNTFGNNKGVDKTVHILSRSFAESMDYDLANASSVLICNTCFKRDDFKEIFGKKGACKAVNDIISRYDGSNNFNATRCMISMFKAIANLALLPTNVKRFLDAGLCASLEVFYRNTDSMSPELIKVSFKTLSNLVMENSESFMGEFSVLIKPILKFLESYNGSDAEVISAALEVLACLCRLPANVSLFVSNDGVSITLRYLNSVKDENCYSAGLKLLAVLCFDNHASSQMIQFGMIAFIMSLLDEFQELTSPDLIVTGLKCLRRVMNTDNNAAVSFPKSGGVAFLCEVLSVAARSAANDNYANSTVVEGVKILLQVLAVHPPPHGTEPDISTEFIVDRRLQQAISRRQTIDKAKTFKSSPSNLMSRNSAMAQHISKMSTMTESVNTPSQDSLSSEDMSLNDSESRTTSTREDITTTRSSVDNDTATNSTTIDLAMSPSSSPTGDNTTAPILKLYKPLGPRRYELIGLDPVAAASLVSGLVVYYTVENQEETSLKLDKIAEFGLTLIAHFVTEKIDGIAFAFAEYPGEFERLIIKIFAETKTHYTDTKIRILIAGIEIVANMACMMDNPEIAAFASSKNVIAALKDAALNVHAKKQANLKRKIEDVHCLLLAREPAAPRREDFFPLQSYDFPVTHADFAAEQYPHGVQDLAPKIKSKIRKGNKCKELALDESSNSYTLRPFYWRSSADLMMLTWMNDKKLENYNHRVALHSFKATERAKLNTSAFKEASQTQKLSLKSCVGLKVNPTDFWPQGLEISLVFGNRRSARKFTEMVNEWQHATAL